MPSQSSIRRTKSSHTVVGYSCVFLGACYVTAVALLVAYLLASLLW